MKKIMFLYHVKEREYEIISFISQQIRKNNHNVEIRSGEFYASILETIQFMPDVIVTIPPRDYYSSNDLTMLKIITGAVVISMSTEGYYTFTKSEVQIVVGHNTYAKELVDYYIVWGEKTKRILGQALYEDGKLSDMRRVKVTGYAWYEKDKVTESYKKYDIYDTVQDWSRKHKKNILILTGFLVADNSIIEYQELGYFGDGKPLRERTPQEVANARESIATECLFREKYIEMISFLAENNPDIGIIVKLHPIEVSQRKKCYDALAMYSNILLVKESVPVGMMLKSVDCMIHYNSTCYVEAYIYNVPTIQLYDDSKETSYQFVWQLKSDSTYLIDINDFEGLNTCIDGKLEFRKSLSVEQILFDLYNWRSKKPYRAIEKTAYYISNARKSQRLKYRDKKVLKTISSKQGKSIINMLISNIFLYPSKMVFRNIFALYRLYKYFLFGKLLSSAKN